MATLYFDKEKKIIRFVKQDIAATPTFTILAQGAVKVGVNMAGGVYTVDIGDFKEAIVALPIVTGERIAFRLTTHSLFNLGLDVWSLPVARALDTLRSSAYLHRVIWDFVGLPLGETWPLVNIVSVRMTTPITAGRDPLRICEGYVMGTKTFFFATPCSRSLGVVVRYQFSRDKAGRLNAIIPERPSED